MRGRPAVVGFVEALEYPGDPVVFLDMDGRIPMWFAAAWMSSRYVSGASCNFTGCSRLGIPAIRPD